MEWNEKTQQTIPQNHTTHNNTHTAYAVAHRYLVVLQKVAVARELAAIVRGEVRPSAVTILAQGVCRGAFQGSSGHRRRPPRLQTMRAVGKATEAPETCMITGGESGGLNLVSRTQDPKNTCFQGREYLANAWGILAAVDT